MVDYKSIIPQVYGGNYDLVSVFDDAMFVIFKLERSSGEIFEIKFSSPGMYSVMNECYGLKTIKERPEESTDGSLLYKVNGSAFLSFFHEQSLGMYENCRFEHYVIMCVDDIVHVIAYEPPIVSQFPA